MVSEKTKHFFRGFGHDIGKAGQEVGHIGSGFGKGVGNLGSHVFHDASEFASGGLKTLEGLPSKILFGTGGGMGTTLMIGGALVVLLLVAR
jgi:hypothetical protein